MEVKLIVMGGKRAGQEVPVPHSKFLIGRAEDCHLRPGSELVSRHHAVILVEDGFVAVRDFGSKNGTFVNGERIRTEQELKAGDHLTVGPLEFEVQLDVPVAGKKKPKVHNVQEAAARTVESVQSAADNDVDISDWLGDDESPTATQTTEIHSLETTPTAGSDIGDTAAIPPHDSPKEGGPKEGGPKEGDPKEGDKENKEKKKERSADFVRRLEKMKKQAAVDSTSAADDVLRKFFGRKS